MQHTDPRTKFPKPGKDESPQEYPGLEARMHTKPDFGLEDYVGANRLVNKVALITGGDSGIGRAVAVTFAQEGADVLIAYLPEEEEDAQMVVHAIQAIGRKVVAIPGNLEDESYCALLVQRSAQEWGRIDILVNNAALQKSFRNFEDMQAADFEAIYRVNVVAPFLISKAAIPHMKPGAAIINTVSIQAYEPSSLLLPYAASKGALVALTKGLAQELIEKGIRVNAVAPGPIWTPLNTHGSPPEKLKQFGEHAPLGRPGQPREVAPLYVLLASDDASYITGEIYGVTGGTGIA